MQLTLRAAGSVDETVFSTPWFKLVSRVAKGGDDPHYFIAANDYVCVVAQRSDEQIVLVRQWRPAMNAFTLELPAGHVEENESPEEAARKELFEETGYTAAEFVPLGCLAPCTGRLGNRLWCFFAGNAARQHDSQTGSEPGVTTILHRGDLSELTSHPEFVSAQHIAAIFLAVQRGYLGRESPMSG